MNLRIAVSCVALLLSSACAAQPQPQFEIELTPAADGATFIDADASKPLIDENGDPISTRITEDESLGTVHTFDLFPVVLAPAAFSESDHLWRIPVWVPSGSSLAEPGYAVTVVLGYSDTVIEYDLLPGRVFEWKAGGRAEISHVIEDLAAGDQIFLHVIGEHSFSPEDLAALGDLGFDYAQLVEGHEPENMAILEALMAGLQPPPGEMRGVGAIFRGVD